MQTLKKSMKMFKTNLPSVLVFEMLYKLISTAILIPTIYWLLDISMQFAGITYLATGTMRSYFTTPSTYAFLFIVLFLLAFYFLVNISGLIYAMDASWHEEKVGGITLLIRSVWNSVRIIKPSNMGMVLYTLLILPFSNTLMFAGLLLGSRIPDVFVGFVQKYQTGLIAFVCVYCVLSFVAATQLYALNYFVLYRLNYKESMTMSKKVVRRNMLRTVGGLMLYNLVIVLVLFALQSAFAGVFAGIMKSFLSSKEMTFVVNTMIQVLFSVGYILFSLISMPLIYAYICTGFYENSESIEAYNLETERKMKRHKRKKKQKKVPTTQKEIEKAERRQRFWVSLMFVICLALNVAYIYMMVSNRVNLNILHANRADVTAHRGDSENAPENTMEAFRLALDNQADIIELDVRQTSDGEFIIMHDESLYRTTGYDKKVGETTYTMIKRLDAGSNFSEAYAGTKIPTLQEVIDFAKEEDIVLNIELKPAKTDHRYAEGIVEILQENDFVDQCMVASTSYSLLRKIKVLDDNIKTVYIMKMAFGEFGDMEDVDVFSIKYTFISAKMVENIHENGKEVYAWTVKHEEDIRKLLLLDVDSIISDDPYRTKEIIYNANDSVLSDWLKELVLGY